MSPTPGWTVVVAAKPAERAKSRLAPLGDRLRRDLAAAMLADVLSACRGAANVREIVVVDGDGGLDAAFRSGIGDGPTALLPADLPCLSAAALERVLNAVIGVGAVQDRHEDGTTLLAARDPALLRPQFGPGSFARHLAGGAVPLGQDEPGLRCDVDTPADLEVAKRLGVGPATAAVARRQAS